jgi:hypothetical protein
MDCANAMADHMAVQPHRIADSGRIDPRFVSRAVFIFSSF